MIAGLGNPGLRYEQTRHNVGFMALDTLVERLDVTTTPWKSRDNASVLHIASQNIVLVKPQSFMNDSGIPLQKLAAWWKVERGDILVISDDLDLPLGRLRIRNSGSSGGQNGLKSIITHLGGEDFPRLRIGIGRGHSSIEHVLAPFSAHELLLLPAVLAAAAEGALRWIHHDFTAAAQFTNSWKATEIPSHDQSG